MYQRFKGALASALLVICSVGAQASIEYNVTNIGHISGTRQIQGVAINNNGIITGSGYDSGNVERAFTWDPSTGTITTLPDISGGHGARAFDINDAGTVVGISWDSSWTSKVVYWSGGSMTNLTTWTNGVGLSPYIAPNGTIAARTDQSGNSTAYPKTYSSGTWTNLTTTTGLPSGETPKGINDAGEVITNDGYFTKGTSYYTLPTLGGVATYPLGLNFQGLIVGYSKTSGGDNHAFLWTPTVPQATSGTIKDLGTLGGDTSIAYGINDWGVVVGKATLTPGILAYHAFIWKASCCGMQDLNSLIDPALGITLYQAYDVNDKGQIVCLGYDSMGVDHTYFLDPV